MLFQLWTVGNSFVLGQAHRKQLRSKATAMTEVTIRPLEKSDHAEWRRLWTDYLTFYKATVPEEVY